ncbi:MAG: UDP-N-acetylenolpyruvoylglucosamine reductase [Alphaproteobacteria bacterium MarineAlpha3_Bin5]|nr:MAG: UDP-N-acetylenolpyruvoylglucosamine reductase [Alphaproteobacteria bacterium MarineAlpha3_Bin5]
MDLKTILPKNFGRYTENAPLAKLCWFRCGGAAEVLFEPRSIEDLAGLIVAKPSNVKITVVGSGSNLLIRDGGVPGLTVKLGKAISYISIDGLKILAGAGTNNVQIARAARDAGIAGLEFMEGIPGSVGGSLRMNAGAYGREIADIVLSVRVIDENGRIQMLPREELSFSYRYCKIPSNWIFIESVFLGKRGTPKSIDSLMKEMKLKREKSQPVRVRTGGSTFINPKGAPAWKLIEDAGCRGLRCGNAMISKEHCNFLVNSGNATAADLETLGEEIRSRVQRYSGVSLEWEIQRIGILESGAGKENEKS